MVRVSARYRQVDKVSTLPTPALHPAHLGGNRRSDLAAGDDRYLTGEQRRRWAQERLGRDPGRAVLQQLGVVRRVLIAGHVADAHGAVVVGGDRPGQGPGLHGGEQPGGGGERSAEAASARRAPRSTARPIRSNRRDAARNSAPLTRRPGGDARRGLSTSGPQITRPGPLHVRGVQLMSLAHRGIGVYVTDQNPTSAGWYHAPDRPGQQRYHDGAQWTDNYAPVEGAQQPGAGGAYAGQTQPQKKSGAKKALIPILACLALGILAVIIIAAAGGGEEDTADDGQADRSTITAEEESTTTEAEEATTTEAATTEAPATEPPATEAPTTEAPAPPPDTVEVGDYTFADVQVSEDFASDFEVRARVTNNGSTKESVAFTATIFSGGSVVGTADGFHDSFEEGSTVTIEFISVDPYTDWDEVEFQIEFEF